VVAYTPTSIGSEQRGVSYPSIDREPVECRTLLTARHSRIPTWIRAERIVTSAVDDPRSCAHTFNHLLGRSLVVCLSEWMAGLYRELGHTTVVVPSMLDDAIYDVKRSPKASGWVCVSAWNKGTAETLALWAEMKGKHPELGDLSVGTPYGAPADAAEWCRAHGARWLGQLTPPQIVRALAGSEAVFRVCVAPETFGVTDAIAEAVGTRVHCLCTNGLGAACEVLESPYVTVDPVAFEHGVLNPAHLTGEMTRKDWRVSKIMPQWIRVLGLEA